MSNDDDYQKKLAEYNERVFPKITKTGEENDNEKEESKLDLQKEALKEESKLDLQKEALKTAHDIRKFEIELYWKRTTYFWSLQGFIFTGFSLLITSLSKFKNKLHTFDGNFIDTIFTIIPIFSIFLALILTFIGIIISMAWTGVNKGSKFWQENWEYHIDFLEDNITGRLYKTVLRENKKTDPYSVSRINQSVSRFITIIWGILFIITSIFFIFSLYVFYNSYECLNIFIRHLICIFALFPFLCLWYIRYIYKRKKKYKSNFIKNKNSTFKDIEIISRETNRNE